MFRFIFLAPLLFMLPIPEALLKLMGFPAVDVTEPIKAGCYSKYFPLYLFLPVFGFEMSFIPPYLALFRWSISKELALSVWLAGGFMGSVCLP